MSIRVICEPKVFLVGEPRVESSGMAAFLDSEGIDAFRSDAASEGEELVEVAGRLCYMSFKNPRPGGNAAYLKHILEVGHGSVTEHAAFNLIITGVSRTLTHELIRHRAGFSYSQLSQRYVDSSDVAFVVPPALVPAVNYALTLPPDSPPALPEYPGAAQYIGNIWIKTCEDALDTYNAIVSYLEKIGPITTAIRKRAREAARSVLPGCTETKIFVTANARALRHFVELRGDAGADAEIRRLAFAVLAALSPAAPALFGDYTITPVDGIETIATPHRKV